MHATLFQIQFKMPRYFFSNPYGVHRKQVTAKLRLASQTIIDAGPIGDGDLIFDNCRKKLLQKAKPKDDPTKNTEPSTTPNVLSPENEHGNAISETRPYTRH